jgi:phospho-N-acetylmuramoyl-pentapeptide-transferase
VISQILLFFAAAVVSFFIIYPVVWILKFFHFSQSIRQEGPRSHQAKSGTPTMGGIGIIVTLLAFSLIFINIEFDFTYLVLVLLVFGFALIGFADDLLKIIRKKNLGLTFWQKIFLQLLFAGLFAGFLISIGHQSSVGTLLKNIGLANPILYFLFSVFIVVGTANATNLTDGLNGLLAGTATIAFLSFGFLAHKMLLPDAVTFSFVAAGSIFAFLPYNFPKARVFMGDVGSLAIGAALAGVALIIHKELALIVIGGLFVVEALSVILQVTTYKLWKKRVFKMTPLHHHFELLGFKEVQIVIGCWIIAAILGLIGALL